MQAAEGDPGKYSWLRDARWTTNHPLEVLAPGELKIRPGTCMACVFGEQGDHSDDCPKRVHVALKPILAGMK
jgi:hypothetical protein